MKKSTKRFILIAIIVILAIIVISVFSYLKNRTHFNNADVSGNIGGNYYNSGLFCEHNDTVYFANPYDDYALYKMTPQGTNAEKLSSDKVSFINADNHYIYYVRDNISKSHSGSSLGFKSATTSSTGGLVLALKRAFLLLAQKGGIASTFTGPL